MSTLVRLWICLRCWGTGEVVEDGKIFTCPSCNGSGSK